MHDFIILILKLLKNGGALALAAAIVCVGGVLIAYALFRRVNGAEKEFPWRKMILLVLLIGYAAVLVYATIVRLGVGYRNVNLHLFRGWREAWNGFSIQLWLNVLLNVVLFVPLGILLPLLIGAMRRWYLMLASGFGTSLCVELLQLCLNRGMFDIDDLFNNTLGAMIGYGLIMAFLMVCRKTPQKSLCYAAVPTAFALAVTGIVVTYHVKEYGNFRDAPSFRANTSDVVWQLIPTLASTAEAVPIYQTQPLTKDSCDAFGAAFAEKHGIAFDDVYYYDGMTTFANHSTGDFLDVYYHDGSYEYTVGGSSRDLAYEEVDEQTLRALMEPYGIALPESADFRYSGNGRHVFSVSMEPVGDAVIDGTLTCRCRENDVLAQFTNNILTLAYCRDVRILTPAEAYAELCRGNFSDGDVFELYKPETVTVLSCRLEYLTDTKGFYRPVYYFHLTDNEAFEAWVFVPAMK